MRLTRVRADVEMRELLRAQAPVAWKPDANFKNCYHCNAEFTFTTRVRSPTMPSECLPAHAPSSGITAGTVATCFATSARCTGSLYHGMDSQLTLS